MLPKKIPSAIPTSKQPIESSVPEQPKKSGKSPTGKNAISTISSDTSLPTLKKLSYLGHGFKEPIIGKSN